MSITQAEQQALENLLTIAQGRTARSRHVADFLLAWWNASMCGSYHLARIKTLPADIQADIETVFRLIERERPTLDILGYAGHIEPMVRRWRPELLDVD